MSNEIGCYSEQRRLAWSVYRYFLSNPPSEEGEDKILYERARRILIDIYCEELNDKDEAAVEKALVMVAKWQNKVKPDDFKIDEKTKNLL